MNREIKFRAWNNSKREWTSFKTCIDMGAFKDGGIMLPYQDVTLMQYTGLKDKNGTEIYEGDIIKWGDHCDWCHEDPVRVAEVKFAPDIQFHSQVGVFEYGNFAYQDTDKHLEVIGNIYENPELLEGK